VNHTYYLRLTFTVNNFIKKKIFLLIVIMTLCWAGRISAQSNTIKIMPLGDSITEGVGDSFESGYRSKLFDLLESAGYNFDFVGTQSSGVSHTLNPDFDADHEGHPGWFAGPPSPDIYGDHNIADSLQRYLNLNTPDIILLHIGTNDMSEVTTEYGKTVQEIANEIINILDTIYFFNNSITTIVSKIIDRNDNENNHTRTMNFNDTLKIKIDSLLGTRNQNIIIADMYNALGLYFGTPVNSNPNFTYWTGSRPDPDANLNDVHPNIIGYGVMANIWFKSLRTVLSLLVDVKVFLEGPYDNAAHNMNIALNKGGYLPFKDPYSQGETVDSIPSSDIVDWVLVELRDKTNASTVIASRAGFIKNNGEIVDINGSRKLNFNGIPFDDYYIVVKHRNHLAVMSNSPVTPSDNTLTYNFTTGSGQFAGRGIGAIEIERGVWGMMAGNSDGNNSISFTDFNAVSNNLFQIGYKLGDHNMNGSVSVTDYNPVSHNLFNISQVP